MKTARFKATAYHEAGHAFLAWYLGVKIESATIVPGDGYAGRIHHEKTIRCKNPDLDRTAVQMEKHIRVCLAGPIAQRIYDPRSCRTLHYRWDNQSAANIALDLYGSSKVATEFLKYLSVTADELLHQSWHKVKALANELMSKRAMTGEEIKTFLVQYSAFTGDGYKTLREEDRDHAGLKRTTSGQRHKNRMRLM